MIAISDRVNPQLHKLDVYEPGKPIDETARELKVDPREIVKLASNENPLGPSPKALAAMHSAIDSAQLYPEGSGVYLRTKISDRLGLLPKNIILGNGSNEIIELIGHAFLDRDAAIVTPAHAFIAYRLVAQLFGAETIEVPTPDFQPDLDAVLSAITSSTKLVFIANPNNPTGALISQEQIDDFMKRMPEHVVTVFDEAYYEFLDHPPDTLRYVREDRNIIVLRTFSKIHGLASLRVGYGIANPPLIEVLQKTRQPFNVNGLGQAAAIAALEDPDHVGKTKHVVDLGRMFLERELTTMKLRVIPSAANFVFVRVGDGPAVFKEMLARKIIVRPLVGYGLPEWLRITVGTMEQNQKCIEALKQVLA
ncbi:MAG TPA: histidinol-phosphate transaminase [Chthoniobacterales bacterium]|nr:histidinol-phosphate transaminase [Chthoniobacterales bacterium]